MIKQSSLVLGALAAAAVSGSALAQSHRLPQAPEYAPPPLRSTVSDSGFYLRGDVAANATGLRGLAQDDLARNGGAFINTSIGNTASVGVGAGYRINANLRVDATWELRTSAALKGTDNVRILNGRGQEVADLYTHYEGAVSSQVAMANAYYDIGTWNGLTPFVGVGLGVARNTVSGLNTLSSSTINTYSATAPYALTGTLKDHTTGYSADRTRYNFAWSLSAGLAYAVSDRLSLEMAYRYMDLGKGAASSVINCTCDSQGQPLKITRLNSHDIKLGMRWQFGEMARPAPQFPIVTKY